MICGAISDNGSSLYKNLNHNPTTRTWKTLVLSYNTQHLPTKLQTFAIPNLHNTNKFRTTRQKPKSSSISNSLTASDDLSFYELLGISERGTFSEIKQAYKQLARKYHPDVSPSDKTLEYTTRFIQVQEAYETLSDPTRRALYDRDLAKGLHLAFNARKYRHHHPNGAYQDGLMAKHEWKNNWQDQLTELKRMSTNKAAEENLSWAAQMRRKRENKSI